MIWLAGLIGLVVVAVLLSSFMSHLQTNHRTGSRTGSRRGVKNRPAASTGGSQTRSSASSCPLCKTPLSGGRRIFSAVFPGDGDRMMHIFGCPDCFPKLAPIPDPRERRCPVCNKQLTLDDFLIARMFPPRPGKPKPHVHVLGCTKCRQRTR